MRAYRHSIRQLTCMYNSHCCGTVLCGAWHEHEADTRPALSAGEQPGCSRLACKVGGDWWLLLECLCSANADSITLDDISTKRHNPRIRKVSGSP